MLLAFPPSAGRLVLRRDDATVVAASQALQAWLGLPAAVPSSELGWAAGPLVELAQALVSRLSEAAGAGRPLQWRGLDLAWRAMPLTGTDGDALLLVELQPVAQTPTPLAPPRPAANPPAVGDAPAPHSGEPMGSLPHLAAGLPGGLYQFQVRSDGTSWFPYAAPGMADLLGVAPELLARDGHHGLRHVHADDVGRFVRAITDTRLSLQAWRLDFRVHPPGRGQRWVRGVSQPERLADGSTLWHGHMWDISDAHAAG